MMAAELFVFQPRHDRDAEANLKQFVSECRERLTVFGPDLDWDCHHWPAAGVMFSRLGQTSRVAERATPMAQPFADFAKSYFRYKRGLAPTQAAFDIQALRCLEAALVSVKGKADPLLVNVPVMDEAARLARENYTGAAYGVGRELSKVNTFVVEHRLAAHAAPWKNPIKRKSDTVRTGPTAAKERERKLPKQAAIDSIAAVFASKPTDPKDIFLTSVSALLLCAPSRISEILELSVDCEVEELTRSGEARYGWRFRPKKGAPPFVKWIPTTMVDLAKEAMRRLRELSAAARRLAGWYEDQPHLLYRHESCPPCGEDEVVSSATLDLALGGINYRKDAVRFAAASSRPKTFRTANMWARSLLPLGFPWFDKDKTLKWRDALFCLPRHIFRESRRASLLLLWQPSNNTLNDIACKFETSFFRRHRTPGGEVIKLTSHQFRHLLSTLSNRGGLSQAELAQWAGRTDPRQNRVYDHVSEYELVDMLRNNDPSLALGKDQEQILERLSRLTPLTPSEFNKLTVPTAHITEIGFCIHDFIMSPCQKFRDCINCTEQVCIKGDPRNKLVPELLAVAQRQIDAASAAVGDEVRLADRWLAVQTQTAARLKGLDDIMNDPDVPVGSMVRLANPSEFSPVRRALAAVAPFPLLSDLGER